MSMAYICGYHNISTGRHCSGDNMILELEKQQVQANLSDFYGILEN